MRQVTSSLRASGVRRSDQQAVWNDIAEKSARLGGGVRHGGYVGDERREWMTRLTISWRLSLTADRQVGAVFLVNGHLAGLELFDAPSMGEG